MDRWHVARHYSMALDEQFEMWIDTDCNVVPQK